MTVVLWQNLNIEHQNGLQLPPYLDSWSYTFSMLSEYRPIAHATYITISQYIEENTISHYKLGTVCIL